MRLELKYCGFTDFADARAALEMGVQKAGFIFAPGSKRNLELNQKTVNSFYELKKEFPQAEIVAVLADFNSARLKELAEFNVFSIFQLHGNLHSLGNILKEISLWIRQSKFSIWLSVSHDRLDEFLANSIFWQDHGIGGIILDSLDQSGYGGTGRSVEADEGIMANLCRIKGLSYIRDIFLAGGLDANNVHSILSRWHGLWDAYNNKTNELKTTPMIFPFTGIDLAGGIEKSQSNPTGQKPVKDHYLMRKFFEEYQRILRDF